MRAIGCTGLIFIVCVLISIFFGYSYHVNSPERANKLNELIVETDGKVDSANEGKLVLFSGKPELANDGVLVDKDLGVKAENAEYLYRTLYQKMFVVEEREVIVDEHDKNDPNDDETKIEKHLMRSWEPASSDRKETIRMHGKKYHNPKKPTIKSGYFSNPLMIGDYKLHSNQIKEGVTSETVYFSAQELNSFCKDYLNNSKYPFKVVENDQKDGFLQTGSEIGDLTYDISYQKITATETVTVIGKQVEDRIEAYDLDGFDQFYCYKGNVSKEEFVAFQAKADSGDRKVCLIIIGIMSVIELIILIGTFAIARTARKSSY